MKTNEHLLKECSQCMCEVYELREVKNKDGRIVYPYFCLDCGNRSPIVEKAETAKQLGYVSYVD